MKRNLLKSIASHEVCFEIQHETEAEEESVDRWYLLTRQLGGLGNLSARETSLDSDVERENAATWRIAGKIARRNCLFITQSFSLGFYCLRCQIVWLRSVMFSGWSLACFRELFVPVSLWRAMQDLFQEKLLKLLINEERTSKTLQIFDRLCLNYNAFDYWSCLCGPSSIGKSPWLCARAEAMIMEKLRGNWGKFTNTVAKAETLLWSETK